PLSFLDHHMKAGNSLIGGQVQEVQDALSRDLFGNQFAGLLSATSLMQEVGKLSDITVAQVSASRSTYRQAYDALAPFKRLLDVWISEYFANKGAQRTASLYAGAIVAHDYGKTNLVDRKAIETALSLSSAKRFFHWELEFPEVFYNETQRKPDGGFDAVIGNPPYGRYDMLDEGSKAFIRQDNLCFGSADLSEAFMDKACRLSKSNKTGLVVPKVFTYVTNWDKIRELLTKKGVSFIADVSQAFEDVLYEQVIYGTGQLDGSVGTAICQVVDEAIKQTHILPIGSLSKDFFPLYFTESSFKTWDKIKKASVQLGQVYDYWYGKGGAVPKLTTKPTEYKVVQGRDIARYTEHYDPSVNLLSKDVSATEKELAQRTKIILQDIVAHVTKPYPHIILMATVDEEKRVALNTVTCCSSKPGSKYELNYLLALLNSLSSSWYVYHFTYNCAIRTMHFMPGYVNRTPIRRINFTTPEKERAGLVEELKEMYREGLEG
ncbi:MAG: Eco57I restriction-modification methylase domain-containing protein, partial [Chloroflexi bacterium]|nr:Eco57I restriction-modification methylase domain-containing protein [Chloroflexota bacterium]